MSILYEAYINFPSYDSRIGSGYGSVGSIKSTPSVGTTLSKADGFPYDVPAKEIDDSDGEKISSKLKSKITTKIGGKAHKNDPFSRNWVDRGAFVNWATRLDLYESKKVELSDVVKGLSASTSTGGISQFLAMGNGAGIFKTKSGRKIGINFGGRPQTYMAKKTEKKIAPKLTDFIKDYIADNE